MSLESINGFKDRIESGKIPPHKRKGFLESFYITLIKGGFLCESRGSIVIAANLLEKYGFENHAKKLRNRNNSYLRKSEHMHSMEPVKVELGETYYTAEQLGDLVDSQLPARVVTKANDGMSAWSNNVNRVSLTETMEGRNKSTHLLGYVPAGELYKFDCKPLVK